jgi:KaiC/GvpD/RAD55 family RecA-like ATPase
MILKYEEALKKDSNKEWFKSFYKKDEVSSDDTVNEINELVNELGGNQILTNYFEISDDMILLKMYEDDLLDYLYDLKDEKATV